MHHLGARQPGRLAHLLALPGPDVVRVGRRVRLASAESVRHALRAAPSTKNHHTIIPFGSGSKLSCDGTTNFFKLTTTGLEPERYYNVLFMVESGSGITKTTQFIDNDDQFKVVE